MSLSSTFNIRRLDSDLDPTRIISEHLLIGTNRECQLLLKHPRVAPIQAVVNKHDTGFILRNVAPAFLLKINGNVIGENDHVLQPGDVIEIGPFKIIAAPSNEALQLEVSRRLVSEDDLDVDDALSMEMLGLEEIGTPPVAVRTRERKTVPPRGGFQKADQPEVNSALAIFLARITDKSKKAEHSPLNPFVPERNLGKRYSWKTTTDLLSRRAFSILVWLCAALLGVALITTVASIKFMGPYFSPGPLSSAHARGNLAAADTGVARQANSNSCMPCHSGMASKSTIENNCVSCHTTKAFTATVTGAHREAGIGCTTCHFEHKGEDFQPGTAALSLCRECHNDRNKESYAGKSIRTPHQGGMGYPVVQGKWSWKGLSDPEWKATGIAVTRLEADPEDKWRSKQFHFLHVNRVRAIGGLPGIDGKLSCSSCHKGFNPIDRDLPRKTCHLCHAETDPARADTPNCSSCHPQHRHDEPHKSKLLVKTPPRMSTIRVAG